MCEHVDIIFYVQPNYRVHTRTYVRTYMYVAHLEFLADKCAEIEMAARSRFLRSRLGVLDRDAPLDIIPVSQPLPYSDVLRESTSTSLLTQQKFLLTPPLFFQAGFDHFHFRCHCYGLKQSEQLLTSSQRRIINQSGGIYRNGAAYDTNKRLSLLPRCKVRTKTRARYSKKDTAL